MPNSGRPKTELASRVPTATSLEVLPERCIGQRFPITVALEYNEMRRKEGVTGVG